MKWRRTGSNVSSLGQPKQGRLTTALPDGTRRRCDFVTHGIARLLSSVPPDEEPGRLDRLLRHDNWCRPLLARQLATKIEKNSLYRFHLPSGGCNPLNSGHAVTPFPTYLSKFASPAANPSGSCLAAREISPSLAFLGIGLPWQPFRSTAGDDNSATPRPQGSVSFFKWVEPIISICRFYVAVLYLNSGSVSQGRPP